jgi:hypothetical protein
MIYEYAVDPSLAAKWGDKMIGNVFLDGFATGTRRISRCPRSWTKAVMAAFKLVKDALPQNERDMYEKRFAEVLNRMKQRQMNRTELEWDNNKEWLENVFSEHRRAPFRAIISLAESRGIEECLSPHDCSILNSYWDAPSTRPMPRDEGKLGEILGSFLCRAKTIILVDPYLGTESRKIGRALVSILKRILLKREGGDPQISLLLSHEKLGSRADEHIDGIKNFVLPKLPHKIELTVKFLSQVEGGMRIHNRFVLTELGTITLGEGLSTSHEGTEDDMCVLAPEHHARRWAQYRPDTLASTFKIDREELIRCE